MKNYEKYLDLVIEASARNIGIDKSLNPFVCERMGCHGCCFYTYDGRTCAERALEWLEAEYVEPEVDWTKVKVDTKILVRDSESVKWIPRHFARYENGVVYAFGSGLTSFTTVNVSPWNYAKLYEGELYEGEQEEE